MTTQDSAQTLSASAARNQALELLQAPERSAAIRASATRLAALFERVDAGFLEGQPNPTGDNPVVATIDQETQGLAVSLEAEGYTSAIFKCRADCLRCLKSDKKAVCLTLMIICMVNEALSVKISYKI